MDRIDAAKGPPGDLGIGHAHSEGFFHAYGQLERIDGIQAKAFRPEEGKVVVDLVWGGLEH